jgi:Holliday junction resolvase RusA-like endonuclease
MTLSVPLPATSANHQYKNIYMTSKSGKKYTGKSLTDEAREWRAMVAILAAREMKRLGLSMIVKEKFSLDCTFYWCKGTRYDCDNLLKMLQDSMIGVSYSNDRYCVPRVIDFGFDELKPGIELTVSCPMTVMAEMI